MTATVVNPQAGGYVTTWPSGQQRTSTSSLNFVAGQTIPNIVIVPVGPNGVIQLFNGSAGSVHLVVDVAGYIRSGAPPPVGTVAGWGYGWDGELGNGGQADSPLPVPVSGLTDVTAIAGYNAGYALRGDGTVVAWGNGSDGALGNDGVSSSTIPTPVFVLTGIVALAAGASTGYALRDDGTVFAWGHGDVGQLGNGSSLSTLRPAPVSGLANVSGIAAATANGYAIVGSVHP